MNASRLNYIPHAGFPFNLNFETCPWKDLEQITWDERIKLSIFKICVDFKGGKKVYRCLLHLPGVTTSRMKKKTKPTDLKHIYKQSYSDAPHLTTVFTGSAHNVSDRCRQYRHGLGGKYRTHVNVGFIMKEIIMSCQRKLLKFRATGTVWTPQRKEEMKVMQWIQNYFITTASGASTAVKG